MTRGIRACTAMAFLGLLAKLAAGYGVYAVARDVFDTETGNQLMDRMLTGDAARDFLRERWRSSSYFGATAHLQVMFMAIAGMLFAGAAGGRVWAALALVGLVLVAVPLDVPLGIVHLAYVISGALPVLPPEMLWSPTPRNLFAVMAYAAGEERPRLPMAEGFGLVCMAFLLFPSVVAATVVIAAAWRPDALQRPGMGLPVAAEA